MNSGNRMRHRKLIGTVIGIIILGLIPLVVHSPYYLDLIVMIIVHAVLGMAFIMLLRVGMINLGIVAFWGIGAYMSAMFVNKFGLSFWASLPLSTLATALVALLLGLMIIEGGTAGFSFVMLTAILGMLFSAVVGNLSYLGGDMGFPNISRPDTLNFGALGSVVFTSDGKVPYFYLALLLFVVVVLVVMAFFACRTGRAWTAIGLNPNLAASMGINVYRYKLLAFVISSAIVALFGSFYAHYQTYLTPNSFNMWVNISVQIYAILGGVGYIILGPLLGATVMAVVPEAMRAASEYASIVTGVILVLLIMFMPQGLLGLREWRPTMSGRIAAVRGKIAGARCRLAVAFAGLRSGRSRKP